MQARIRLIHKALASLTEIHEAGRLDATELQVTVDFVSMQLALIESEAALPAPIRTVPLLTLADVAARFGGDAPRRPTLTSIEGGKSS